MARETLLQTSFNTGEISPRLVGRSDWQKYSSAVARLSNCIGLVSGPATFRPGTTYVAQSGDMTKTNRLIPFKYSTVQTYILEFGEGTIRFFKDKGVILSDRAIANGEFDTDLTSWTDNDSGAGVSSWVSGEMQLDASATGTAARYQQLDYIGIATYTVTLDVTGSDVTWAVGTSAGGTQVGTGTISAGTGQTFTFTPTTAGTVYLQFSRSTSGTSTVDNVVLDTPEYIIENPYVEADLPALTYAQDADVLYLTFESMTIPPKILKRFDHDNWTISDVSFVDGPYLDTNTSTTTFSINTITVGTGRTLTASASTFVSTDVGRLVRHRSTTTGKWGTGVITAYGSPTSVTVTVLTAWESTAASITWRLGAFSDTTGYPGVVTFHEGRLGYARTPTQQNFYWFSESQGAGSNQVLWAPTVVSDGTVTDSNSFYGPLSAGDVSAIMWMSSGASLAIGTASSEWVGEPGDTSEAISPSNFRITRRTTHGSLPNVSALRIDGTVLYAKSTGSRVNRFVFNFAKDDYDSTNISLLGEHLFAGKTIVDMVYAPEPFSLAWVLLDDGTLNALTFVDSEEVGGWSQHQIAGQFGISSGLTTGSPMGMLILLPYSDSVTWGVVESIGVIPANDGSYSEVWMTVKRTINNTTVRYIEVMNNAFFYGDPEEAAYLDSALYYSGGITSTLSGLDHLEGETVVVFTNAFTQIEKTVSSGSITLDEPTDKAWIGLYYEGDIETLDFDAQNAFGGSSLGQIRRISDVKLSLFESGSTYTGLVGEDDSDLNQLVAVRAGHVMNQASPLFTGFFPVQTDVSWDLSSRIHIQMRSPFPCTVRNIMFKATVNEG